MDLDRLRLIMETLATLGGDAKQAVIWYFALHYGTHILTVLAGITGAIIAVRTVFHGIKAVNKVEADKEIEKANVLRAFMQLANVLGITSRVYVRESAQDTDSDGVTHIVSTVQQRLNDLKAVKDELDKTRKQMGDLQFSLSRMRVDLEIAQKAAKQ